MDAAPGTRPPKRGLLRRAFRRIAPKRKRDSLGVLYADPLSTNNPSGTPSTNVETKPPNSNLANSNPFASTSNPYSPPSSSPPISQPESAPTSKGSKPFPDFGICALCQRIFFRDTLIDLPSIDPSLSCYECLPLVIPDSPPGLEREHLELDDSFQQTIEECQVCLDELSVDSFPVISIHCQHAARCCSTCVPHYFSSMQSSGQLEIFCPVGGCQVVLSYEDIERLAPPQNFAWYDRELRRQCMRTLEEFVFCSADGCEFGMQIHARIPGMVMNCQACQRSTCVECEAEHESITCEQFRKGQTASEVRNEENQASTVWLKENARACPGKCARVYWKSAGCDHMYCARCKIHWCWYCLKHFKKWTGCAHIGRW